MVLKRPSVCCWRVPQNVAEFSLHNRTYAVAWALKKNSFQGKALKNNHFLTILDSPVVRSVALLMEISPVRQRSPSVRCWRVLQYVHGVCQYVVGETASRLPSCSLSVRCWRVLQSVRGVHRYVAGESSSSLPSCRLSVRCWKWGQEESTVTAFKPCPTLALFGLSNLESGCERPRSCENCQRECFMVIG